jgi:hypothetical protein
MIYSIKIFAFVSLPVGIGSEALARIALGRVARSTSLRSKLIGLLLFFLFFSHISYKFKINYKIV